MKEISKAWDWNKNTQDFWHEPCEESYYLLNRWTRGRDPAFLFRRKNNRGLIHWLHAGKCQTHKGCNFQRYAVTELLALLHFGEKEIRTNYLALWINSYIGSD